MNRTLHLLLLLLALLCLSSCNGDRRMVKKFIYRMNAHKVNAASKYIYQGDYIRLYIFNKEVYAKSPNMMFKIIERKKGFVDGQKCVFVKLQCENSTPYFIDHMENLGLLHPDDIIIDHTCPIFYQKACIL